MGALPMHHAVVVALPGAMGHINPMLHLAKNLAAYHTVRVTFVYTATDLRRLKPPPRPLSNGVLADPHLPNLVFEIIADSIPPNVDRPIYWRAHRQEVEAHLQQSLDDLLTRLKASTANPPPTCIISDYFVSWTHNVASKHRLSRVLFWPQSATVLAIYSSTPLLEEKGLVMLTEDSMLKRGCEAASVELLNAAIPGLPSLRGVDLPYYWSYDGTDFAIRWISEIIKLNHKRLPEAALVLCNTFSILEEQAMKYLQQRLPVPIVPVGPLVPRCFDRRFWLTRGPSYWPQDQKCISWLDTRPPKTVLFVSLGSIVNASAADFQEIAMGLLASKHAFLWVIRGLGESANVSEDVLLPQGFLKATQDRGLVVSWAPQLEVLSHAAVGGFLTHGGWNSTIEAISMGVPMIVWPWIVDQKTNSRLVTQKWGVGVELVEPADLDYIGGSSAPLEPGRGRIAVEKSVRALMDTGEGTLHSNAAKLSVEAEKAATFVATVSPLAPLAEGSKKYF